MLKEFHVTSKECSQKYLKLLKSKHYACFKHLLQTFPCLFITTFKYYY